MQHSPLNKQRFIWSSIATGLNAEQRKAFFLVCDHRRRNHSDSNSKPSQLLLYLGGAGGTGKSRVIKSICEYFERINKRETLLVLAYTGIAASNISGSTIHSVCGLSFGEDDRRSNKPTGSTLAQLQDRWSKVEYVIIDEISMIGQKLLAKFHESLKIAKSVDHDLPFAGLNILFAGDFLQLPPVQDPALYVPSMISRLTASVSDKSPSKNAKRKHNSTLSIGDGSVKKVQGRELWLSVKHVVQLKQPMRQIDDLFYANILESMRHGKLSEDQRQALRSKILGDDRIANPEWRDAVFLVSRNQIRVQMNFDATKEYADKMKQFVVYSCAEDTYKKIPLKGSKRRSFLSASDTKENALSGILPLSIGMKVVLTVNICTNDGLANGVEGILRQIVFDKDSVDRASSKKKKIVLKRVPKYVTVELLDRTPGPYDNLPPKHVPIYPLKCACVHTFWRSDGTKVQYNFQRFQLPLTPAFAFTDYKCQGRTLRKVVVDLAESNASTGMYVMLSRVQRLSDLLILRPFNESLLDMKIPVALREELKRLEACARDTEQLESWPDEKVDVFFFVSVV